MRVLILGVDGYLGFPLAQHLISRRHTVFGLDSGRRRSWVRSVGSYSAIPIASMHDRRQALIDRVEYEMPFSTADMEEFVGLRSWLEICQPEAIVHLAENPSAPFSMRDVNNAALVMRNNVIGTLHLLFAMRDVCPDAHLIKLGTMGEYGTPPIDIPEGFFDIEFRGRRAHLPFPRDAGSWYHWTKVHDSNNVRFACRIWGLRSTDLMQGVVYGTWAADEIDQRLVTRLDFDQYFGTAINRFCCQAIIGHPLTVYGDVGKQTRGYLPLSDSVECLTLTIENPPEPGEYRVFNQLENTYSAIDLANRVKSVADTVGLGPVEIAHYEAPRVESEDHYYNPDRQGLRGLGYDPKGDMDISIGTMLMALHRHRDRIKAKEDLIVPDTRWSGKHRIVKRLR